MHVRDLNKRGFSVVEVLVVIGLITLVAVMGWMVYDKHAANNAMSPASPGYEAAQAGGESIASIKATVGEKYPWVAITKDQWVAQMGAGASIPAPGYEYRVSTQNFETVYFGLRADYNPDRQSGSFPDVVNRVISKTMSDHGFKTVQTTFSITSSSYGPDKTMPKYVTYKLEDTTCLVINDDSQPMTLSCFGPADIQHTAVVAKPFVAAYVTANPLVAPNSITFGPLTIKSRTKSGVIGPSQSPGYDISEAVLTIDGSKKLVLFYNKNGGQWTYVAQANDEYGFPCGAYTATTDMRKAMYNQICLSSAGQVRLDSSQRALQ